MAALFTHGYAVVVGVGADLPNTITDADAVAALLKDPERCAYPPDQVRLLTGPQAQRDDVLAALGWLADATRQDPDATAIVYFSGHGMQSPDFRLILYAYRRDDLPGTTISGVEFTDKLRAVQAARLVVLLDCCYAAAQAIPKAPLSSDILAELGRGNGRVVLASSRKYEESLSGSPYSVFTASLLQALAGAGAAEHDGYARVLDIALYVGRMVPNRTADRQHPTLSVANLENNFVLAYYAGGAPQPKALDWSPAPLFPQTELFSQFGPSLDQATLREMLRQMSELLSQGTLSDAGPRPELTPPPPRRERVVIRDLNDLYRFLVNYTTCEHLISLCHHWGIDTSRFDTASQPTFARQLILHLQRAGRLDGFARQLTRRPET